MTNIMQINNEYLEQKIYQVRSQKVMLESDLAELYGVETRRLNEQVRRNVERFPVSFMFQLSPDEEEVLRSQIATSKMKTLTKTEKRGGRRYATRVFTEHGVLMLANVLRKRAGYSGQRSDHRGVCKTSQGQPELCRHCRQDRRD